MKNVSLVAFYGDKPIALSNLIQQMQTYLANHYLLQNKFIPYQLEQVHSTIIGCEGHKTEEGIVNQWFQQHRQETRYIDFSGLINYWQQQLDLSIIIRFGGYERNINYNFLSHGEHPRDRSFQLKTKEYQTIPIVIGWSWQNEQITLAIDNLRRNLKEFNLLHKYHKTPEAIDNDFYLRLGTIQKRLSQEECNGIMIDLHHRLANQAALSIPITLRDIAFVQYQDLLLTPSKTKAISIADISAAELKQFYSARTL